TLPTPTSTPPAPITDAPTATTTPLPPTPGPPTATPALPEEGGPPGGVLGGYVYLDTDGDGRRSAGDSTVSDASVNVARIISDRSGTGRLGFYTLTDNRGHWEVRGVPDGTYVVSRAPSARDPSFAPRPVPPPPLVRP